MDMFRNDYSEIGAPEVLDALAKAAGLPGSSGKPCQYVGYGLDGHSAHAAELILERFGLTPAEADVHFLAGGTQTNTVVISYLLRPWEAVIAADTGHINVHETGAVEGSGHKVITVPGADGKVLAADVERVMARHTDEHMVRPRMVYISDSTETGTVYSAAELVDLRAVCDRNGLSLFLDGARLGVALTAPGGDVDAALIGRLCDVFYVGGTKNGALLGEAVVLKKALGGEDFRFHVKNRGAMLAKGFAVGIQFEALFEDDLYFRLAANSNRTAALLRQGLAEAGMTLVGRSTTNQLFVRVTPDLADALTDVDRFGCELWTDEGETRVVRIVTSFATTDKSCEELLKFIRQTL